MKWTYHLGLLKDYHNPRRVILQVRESVDCLSPELWRYMGQRIITKAELKAKRAEILALVNQTMGTAYQTLTVD